MAVAIVTTGSASGKRVTSHTVSALAVSGSDLAIYCIIHGVKKANGDAEASSVVWDSAGVNESFTDLGSIVRASSVEYIEIWRLVGPTAKTADITVTFPDNNNSWNGGGAGAFVLSGVDSGTPDDGFLTGEGSTSPATISVTSAADDLAVGGATVRNTTATPVGGSQSDDWNVLQNECRLVGSSEDVDSAVLDWTLGVAAAWVAAALNINAAAAAAAAKPPSGLALLGVGT